MPEAVSGGYSSSGGSGSVEGEDFAAVLSSIEAAANIPVASNTHVRNTDSSAKSDSPAKSDSSSAKSSVSDETSVRSEQSHSSQSEPNTKAKDGSTTASGSQGATGKAEDASASTRDTLKGVTTDPTSGSIGKNVRSLGSELIGMMSGFQTGGADESVPLGGKQTETGLVNLKRKNLFQQNTEGSSSKAVGAAAKGLEAAKTTSNVAQATASEAIAATSPPQSLEEGKIVDKSKRSEGKAGFVAQETGKKLVGAGKSIGVSSFSGASQDAQAFSSAADSLTESTDSDAVDKSAVLRSELHEGLEKKLLDGTKESSTDTSVKGRHSAVEGVESGAKSADERVLGSQVEEQTQTAAEKSADARATTSLRSNNVTTTNAEVVRQVQTQLEEMVTKVTWTGTQKATLNLNPPQLGSVDVEVIVRGDHVKAVFTASTPLVREALESGMNMLKHSLSDAGMGGGQADVFLKQENSQGKEESGSKSGSRSRTPRVASSSTESSVEAGVLNKFRQGQGEHSIYVRA